MQALRDFLAAIWGYAPGVMYSGSSVLVFIGLVQGGDRPGLVAGVYLALAGIALRAVQLLVAGTFFVSPIKNKLWPGVVPCAYLAILPLVVLFWHKYDGFAWLWVIAWGVWGVLAYKAVLVAVYQRYGLYETTASISLAAPYLQLTRWTAVVMGGGYLVLANTVRLPLVGAMLLGVPTLVLLAGIANMEHGVRREAERVRKITASLPG